MHNLRVTDTKRVPAGLTPERLGFFTDAVFAIAMTLLVIEIPRPENEAEFAVGDGVTKAEAAGNLLRFLSEQSGSFIAYLVAFYVLWNLWRSHHRLFDSIDTASHRLVMTHFPYLLLIGYLPYATTTFGHHSDNPAAAVLFTLVVGALQAVRSALQTQAYAGGLLRSEVDAQKFRRTARSSWLVAGWWGLSLALAWWTPWIILAWAATPVLFSLLDRRTRD